MHKLSWFEGRCVEYSSLKIEPIPDFEISDFGPTRTWNLWLGDKVLKTFAYISNPGEMTQSRIKILGEDAKVQLKKEAQNWFDTDYRTQRLKTHIKLEYMEDVIARTLSPKRADHLSDIRSIHSTFLTRPGGLNPVEINSLNLIADQYKIKKLKFTDKLKVIYDGTFYVYDYKASYCTEHIFKDGSDQVKYLVSRPWKGDRYRTYANTLEEAFLQIAQWTYGDFLRPKKIRKDFVT